MDTISVIIPVYNTYRELMKCLDSVCCQTYKNIEIILVDDGSNDGSEKIVDEYASIDNRIIVIHKENGGESSARNIGLEKATGSIISFLDCDDWIDSTMYEIMVEEMRENNLDICACGWTKEYVDKSVVMSNALPLEKRIMNREEFLKKIYMRDSYQGFAYMWNKLYKKEVLIDKNGKEYRFNEQLSIGGDVVFLAFAALNAKRVKYIDKSFYHYYQRENSGVHSLSISKMRDWISAYGVVLKMLTDEHISDEVIDYVKRFMAYHASNGVRISINDNDIEAKCFFQKIMKDYQEEYCRLNYNNPSWIKEFNVTLEL